MGNLSQNAILFWFSFLLLSPLKVSQSACNRNDEKALLQIKTYFKNSSVFSSWNPEIDCCEWNGNNAAGGTAFVGCYDQSNPDRITKLVIAGVNDFFGQIPAAIGNLPYLEELSLSELPNLTGPIPVSITKLTKLATLTLMLNSHTGQIPGFLVHLKSLYLLDLSSNGFTGTIPSSCPNYPALPSSIFTSM